MSSRDVNLWGRYTGSELHMLREHLRALAQYPSTVIRDVRAALDALESTEGVPEHAKATLAGVVVNAAVADERARAAWPLLRRAEPVPGEGEAH